MDPGPVAPSGDEPRDGSVVVGGGPAAAEPDEGEENIVGNPPSPPIEVAADMSGPGGYGIVYVVDVPQGAGG